MNLFIACTPLQLINILNIRQAFFPEEMSDLVIQNSFSGAKEIYKKIKKLNLFNNVYLLEPQKKIDNIHQKFNLVLNRSNILYGNESIKKYNKFFITGKLDFSRFLFGELKKQNPEMKLCYVDDGLASYIPGQFSLITEISTIQNFLLKKLNRFSIHNYDFDEYYLMDIELTVLPKDKAKEIPRIDSSEVVVSQLKKLFENEEKSNFIENTIIFLDQPFKEDGFSFNEFEILRKIEEFNKGKKKLLIKLHPRSHKDKYGKDFELLETALPFEMLLLNTKLKNNVIVNPLSTSTFSSILMLGKEVQTVFLSKYISEENGFDINPYSRDVLMKINRFVEEFENSKNAGMLSLPTSASELEELLVGQNTSKGMKC